MPIRGAVDEITSTGAQGWIYGANGPMSVRAVLDGRVLAEGAADRLRPDLAAVGFGDGRCGFHLSFGEPVSPLHLPFVSIKPDAGDVDLPRTGLAAYRDVLKAASERKPAAGRPRSVYGGLWTDRTDAAALLKSKLRIGQVSLQLAPGLESLIREGAVVLQLDGGSSDLDPARAVGKLLADPRLLPLLRAALEDAPHVAVAEVLATKDAPFAQPSTWRDLPSPAEALGLLFPAAKGDKLEVEVVRDSHLWPEFRGDGLSRWCAPGALPAPEIMAQAVLDRVSLGPGQIMVVAPGTVVRPTGVGGAALRVLCIPTRAAPAAG